MGYLAFVILQFEEREEFESHLRQEEEGAYVDGHAKSDGVGTLIVNDLLKLHALVVCNELGHLVDGAQVLQAARAVDEEVSEHHILCEVFLQHGRLPL